MKAAWATDIHLSATDIPRAKSFCREVNGSGAEALFLGGDIAEAPDLEDWLFFLDENLAMPIYFVLGNHDYYGGDIKSVEARMLDLASPKLNWLPGAGVVSLTNNAALVGHGGWGDARYGDFLNSPVILSDYVLIRDLQEASGSSNPIAILDDRPALQRKLQQLGDDAADQLRPWFTRAVEAFPEVFVLMHVPPFREACWHQGKVPDTCWLPSLTCKAVGDMILDVVMQHEGCDVTVLCGHTHGEGKARLLPNLVAYTQGAVYGDPHFRLLTVH